MCCLCTAFRAWLEVMTTCSLSIIEVMHPVQSHDFKSPDVRLVFKRPCRCSSSGLGRFFLRLHWLLLLRVWDTSMAHRVCIGYMHSRLWTNTRLRQITPSKVSLTLAASHVTLPSLSAKKNQYQPDCVPELALGEHEASPMLPRDKPL